MKFFIPLTLGFALLFSCNHYDREIGNKNRFLLDDPILRSYRRDNFILSTIDKSKVTRGFNIYLFLFPVVFVNAISYSPNDTSRMNFYIGNQNGEIPYRKQISSSCMQQLKNLILTLQVQDYTYTIDTSKINFSTSHSPMVYYLITYNNEPVFKSLFRYAETIGSTNAIPPKPKFLLQTLCGIVGCMEIGIDSLFIDSIYKHPYPLF